LLHVVLTVLCAGLEEYMWQDTAVLVSSLLEIMLLKSRWH